jgi:hypothetical protein
MQRNVTNVSGNIVDVANADMSLPVISKLKLTDRGLFNVEKFEYLNGIGTAPTWEGGYHGAGLMTLQ